MKIALCLLILFTSSTVLAQKSTDRSQIKLRGLGRTLVLSSGGDVRFILDVSEQVSAAKLDEVKLLFETRKGSFTYLLVDACGPSKAVPDAKRCGAADECSLLWLKVDAAWKVSGLKGLPYLSCWRPISSSDYKLSGRTVEWEYDDFGEKKHYKISYDADEPERGFQTTESAVSLMN